MGKVHIGFFSFTEVTGRAEHRSYNGWHQLDHMPEQYQIPGLVFGQRWVSTPACRRARAFDSPTLEPIHYMTLYLMGEPVDATLVEFRALGERLRGANRFFEHRRSRLSGPFAVTGAVAAPRVLVSADATPYRPNRGVYVVVHDRAAAPAAPSAAAGRRPESTEGEPDGFARAAVEADGVAGVWTFATDGRFAGHGWRPGDKTITVCYLDDEPLAVVASLDEFVRAEAARDWSSVLFAGPLETITPWHWDWFDTPT
jgi:hypothetical protein